MAIDDRTTMDRVHDIQEQVTARASQARDVIASRAGQAKDVIADGLTEVDKVTRSFVEDHPFLSLGIAIGAGFFVGRLVSGR